MLLHRTSIQDTITQRSLVVFFWSGGEDQTSFHVCSMYMHANDFLL